MQRLRQAYPHVPDTDLQRVLGIANGDVLEALRLLRPASKRGRCASFSHHLIVEIPKSEEPKNPTIVPGTSTNHVDRQALHSRPDPNAEICGKDNRIQNLEPIQWQNPTVNSNHSGCCFEDVPAAEVTLCSNLLPHHFCFRCARKYAESEIGKMRYELVCLDSSVSACSAPFLESEIKRFLDPKTYECLDKIRTNHYINEASLEGLVYCPFCDFAAIMEDPTDRIFECVGCGVSSCRYCRVKSHHPQTCEKYQAEIKLATKHIVEEAMTAALLRKCNKCGKEFVKSGGCNKMKCVCGNLQCFVCSADNVDYSHFDHADGLSGRCPLYRDMSKFLEEQVSSAQEKKMQELLEARKELTEDDIRVDKKKSENGNQFSVPPPLLNVVGNASQILANGLVPGLQVQPPRPPNPAPVRQHGNAQPSIPNIFGAIPSNPASHNRPPQIPWNLFHPGQPNQPNQLFHGDPARALLPVVEALQNVLLPLSQNHRQDPPAEDPNRTRHNRQPGNLPAPQPPQPATAQDPLRLLTSLLTTLMSPQPQRREPPDPFGGGRPQ